MSTDDTRQPSEGEIISRNNVVLDTTTTETDEAIPLGDCRCSAKRK